MRNANLSFGERGAENSKRIPCDQDCWTSLKLRRPRAKGHCKSEAHARSRARSHCCFALPLVHFIPDLLT
jgi:hypothetical protein